MKVAVLAHSFPRFPGDTHGTFVKSLCEALARRGHEMHVLVPFDPELAPDPDSPLHVHSFRYVWPDRWHLLGYSRTLKRDIGLRAWAYLQSPLYFLFAERALARLVRSQGIELVHAHWHLPNGFVACRVRRRTGVPFAVTLHGSDVFMAERNALFGAMARQALAGASHVTSCSADLRERLLRVGGEEHGPKVLLVANGTDLAPVAGPPEAVPGTSTVAATRDRLGVGDGDRLVVAVGRMVDKKGFRYLLEAAPAIVADHPEARIVLGGGGDLLPQLRDQARELGLGDRVLFPGPLEHHQVLELLAAAEVFVMPSVRDRRGNIDGLPIVVLEAMAAARPVVATNVAGMPLAVDDGDTGVLVPDRNPEALASAVGELLAHPERAQRMGEAGLDKVRRELNWDAIAGRHDELYRLAIG